METLNDSIARAIESGRPHRSPSVVTARACMTGQLITTTPEQTVKEAMATLLRHGISGMPVVEGNHQLVGMISEIDCLRALASGSYDSAPFESARLVGELMSRDLVTIEPEMEIFTIVRVFDMHSLRRLPVVEDGIVIGQVSRRDVLRKLSVLGAPKR
jgi:CBS domain-containing protein